MSTSRVPAVIDYLVTTFRAAAALGTASPPVAVYDGPTVTLAPERAVLWVGMDDPDSAEGAPVAAEAQQEWVGLGNYARNETLTINCVAEAWSGDNDVRTVRLAVYAIVAAVEDITRVDASLGGTVLFTQPGVTGSVLRQSNVETGAVARVAFNIACKARIGA